jgi:hypothetical protein
MVTPEPPVNAVKNEHTAAQTTAVPPGIHPTHARNMRSSRPGAPPSTNRNPASVKSGIAGKVEDVLSAYVSTSTVADGTPAFMNNSAAAPPRTVKIGAPSTPATRHNAIAAQAGVLSTRCGATRSRAAHTTPARAAARPVH